MEQLVKPHDAAAAIAVRDKATISRLVADMRADSELASRDLSILARDPSERVRDWVVQWAPQLLGEASIEILTTLSADVDSGVRNAALHALTKLDPGWARRQTSIYLEMLGSPNVQDVRQAIWRLTRFREPSAIGRLKVLAAHADWSAIQSEAGAAVLVLEGEEDVLISRLWSHDHDTAQMWMKALLYLGTEKALNALREFALRAPDEECARRARDTLQHAQEVVPIVAN